MPPKATEKPKPKADALCPKCFPLGWAGLPENAEHAWCEHGEFSRELPE